MAALEIMGPVGMSVAGTSAGEPARGGSTSLVTVRAADETTLADAAFDVAGFAVFALVAMLLARRMALRTRVDLALGR